MEESKTRPEDWNHQYLGLKVGDRAFIILEDWGKLENCILTGFCDDGHGFQAVKDGKEIHTCNGFLTESRDVARQEAIRRARIHRKKLSDQQAVIVRWIQFLDSFIANRGRT